MIIKECTSVKDMIKEFESVEKGDALAKKLKEAEQQLANNQKRIKQTDLHNQHPAQYTIHNDEQTSLNRINSNDSGIYAADESKDQSIVSEDGEDINARDGDGRIRLHLAVENADEESVKLLIERGAEVNTQDKDGHTPLHFAVAYNDLETVKHLVKNGAEVDTQDKDGRTPLHFAVALSDLEVVKFLIKGGADVKTQDKSGQSILHYAATRDNIEIVKYLIKKGADVGVQNDQKQYLRDTASINNCTKVAKFLQETIESKKDLKKKKGKTRSGEKRPIRSNDELNLSNGSNDKVEMLEVQSLKKAQKELTKLKNCVAGHETRLEALNKLNEENQSLKQKTQNLESENATLKDELEKIKGQHSNDLAEHEVKLEELEKQNQEENQSLKQKTQGLESENATLNGELEKIKGQHSNDLAEHKTRLEALNKLDKENESLKQENQDLKSENATLRGELDKTKTNEVPLEKTELRLPKVAYVSLTATLIAGSILSIASGLFVLSIIATSVTSALIAGGIAYTMSKPTTELKEVDIDPVQHGVCKT